MIINLYKHRGYIWRNAWGEVRTRYAGSAAGVFWNLLQPLAQILVYAIIFTHVVGRQAMAEIPGGYVVYLCSLLLPWLAFSECISKGTMSFVSHAHFLVKLPIPEQVFMAQTVLSAAFNLVISYSIFLVIAALLGQPVTWHWLLLPLPLGFMLAFAFGVALLLGTINAFIRDTATVVGVVLSVGFWMYPIIYDIRVLPEWMQGLILWNPLHPSFTSIRDLLLWQRVPGVELWLGMAAWAAASCSIGYLTLRRLRPELRDVL